MRYMYFSSVCCSSGCVVPIMSQIVKVKVSWIFTEQENATGDPKVVEQGIFLCYADKSGIQWAGLRSLESTGSCSGHQLIL